MGQNFAKVINDRQRFREKRKLRDDKIRISLRHMVHFLFQLILKFKQRKDGEVVESFPCKYKIVHNLMHALMITQRSSTHYVDPRYLKLTRQLLR